MHFRPLHDRVVVPRHRTGMPPASGSPSSDPATSALTPADANAAPRATVRLWTMPRPRRRTERPVVPQPPLSAARAPDTEPECEPEFTRGGIPHGAPG